MGSLQLALLPKSKVQMVQDQSNQLLQRQGTMFKDIGAIVELEHNEITFTWLLFFVFTLYSFHYLDDFLLLGSRSLSTKLLFMGKTSIQIYFEVQTFFSVLSAKMSND